MLILLQRAGFSWYHVTTALLRMPACLLLSAAPVYLVSRAEASSPAASWCGCISHFSWPSVWLPRVNSLADSPSPRAARAKSYVATNGGGLATELYPYNKRN